MYNLCTLIAYTYLIDEITILYRFNVRFSVFHSNLFANDFTMWKLCCRNLTWFHQHCYIIRWKTVFQSNSFLPWALMIGASQKMLSWWRHQMQAFSALLTICAGNSPVPVEFPAQRPVTRSFDVFFDLRLNKWLSKNRKAGGLRRCHAHYDVIVMCFLCRWPEQAIELNYQVAGNSRRNELLHSTTSCLSAYHQ